MSIVDDTSTALRKSPKRRRAERVKDPAWFKDAREEFFATQKKILQSDDSLRHWAATWVVDKPKRITDRFVSRVRLWVAAALLARQKRI
ncbi:MAG: hypothetical protein ACKVW3_11840 [Phycisphaerales bacterium]